MEQTPLWTELILNYPQRSLGNLTLDWMPQPGAQITHEGTVYAVLERRHRYQFKANRYHLYKVALYVQAVVQPDEKSLVGDRWVIGDATCRYNARSEMVRCAVQPAGPCRDCHDYSPVSDSAQA